MPGTETENQMVTPMVAEDEDKDTLIARLAEAEAKNKEYESRIGRQVQVSGDRIKSLEENLQNLAQNLEAEQQARQQAELKARWDRMTPTQQATLKEQMTTTQLSQLQGELAQMRQREADKPRIDALVKQAKDEGYDTALIDTSSYGSAKASFDEAEKQYLRQALKAVRTGQVSETKELIDEATRALVGRRTGGTGAPSTTQAPAVKVPDEIAQMDREYQALKKKSVSHPGTRARMWDIVLKAERMGYHIS